MDPALDAEGPRQSPRGRLLVLYAEIEEASALVRRLGRGIPELVLCPLSVSYDNWLCELRPDLILLQAPKGSQKLLAACELTRSRTDLPIAVLAATGDDLLVAKVLGLGIDEYLALPIGDHELLARVDALLRRLQRYQVTGNTITVGDVTLSSRERTVERRGRKMNLSPIEYRLLSCFVSAPGTVLTHQTLMARVWGAEYVDSRHYLRLYVRYLREKLGDDLSKPKLIISEWGVGYRFQPHQPALAAPSN